MAIHHTPTDWRPRMQAALDHLLRCPDEALPEVAQGLIAPEATLDLAAPLPRVTGPCAVVEGWLRPLRRAFGGVHRRELLFLGGRNTRGPGRWIAALTHYVGQFQAPFCGLAPSGHLSFLRAGEFYRIEDGQILEAKILFDLPDLMRQAHRFPLPHDLGTEVGFPAPATQDGLWPSDGEHDAASMGVVDAMLSDLHVFDPVTMASAGQEGYWHPDMLWYGPAGIGSNFRWQGFVQDHRRAFLTAFPDRKGGAHYCRLSDGAYAAVSGWPSMTMTHQGPYLGCPPTGRALTLRVMDFYRCSQGRIAENWVCLDLVDLACQMGRDLIAEANAMPVPRQGG